MSEQNPLQASISAAVAAANKPVVEALDQLARLRGTPAQPAPAPQPQGVTAADVDRILQERLQQQQQLQRAEHVQQQSQQLQQQLNQPRQNAARDEFIAQQQARAFDGLDGVPPEYLKGIGDDPARWPQEVKRARLQWRFDTGKTSSTEAMELALMDSKPARETPTTTLDLANHLPGGGGGGGPNRAA
jgi:DNA-binding transcriptional MerR regulator